MKFSFCEGLFSIKGELFVFKEGIVATCIISELGVKLYIMMFLGFSQIYTYIYIYDPPQKKKTLFSGNNFVDPKFIYLFPLGGVFFSTSWIPGFSTADESTV